MDITYKNKLTDDQEIMLEKMKIVGPISCDRLSSLTGFNSTRCSELCRQLVYKGMVKVAGGNAMRRLYEIALKEPHEMTGHQT